MVEKQNACQLKSLKCDRNGENILAKFDKFYAKEGIDHQFIVNYTP